VGSLSAANYVFSLEAGTLTIGDAVLTVTVNNVSRGYGETNPVFTVSYSGFLPGDNTNVLSGAPQFSCSAETNSPVTANPYEIVIGPGTLSASNYDFVFVDGRLTVTQAVITVQADSQTKVYGAALPSLTFKYSGFVNGEDTNSLSGAPELSTDATTMSSVSGGPYLIQVAIGTLSATNYSFSVSNAGLTITPLALTGAVTVNNKSYDGTATATIASRTLTGVLGSDVVSLSGGTALFSDKDVGSGKSVFVTDLALSGADSGNYTANDSTTASANITAAPLIGQVDDKQRAYGQTNPLFTVTYTGFVNSEGPNILNGQFIGSTTATINSPVGNYAITGSGQSSMNYSIVYLNGTLTVLCTNTPVANTDEIGVLENHSVIITTEKLLANDTDSGDAMLAVVNVSALSTNGGTVAMNENAITFTPAAGFNGVDLFTYTLSDGCNTATGSVLVTVLDIASPSANRIGDLLLDTDGAHVRFAAIPGFTYAIERSSTNESWTAIGSVVTPPTGIIEFLDQNPPSGAIYYRTRVP
jgi:hypothetical protein